MTNKPLTANRAFQQMRQSALQRLRGRTAADTAARTGIPFDGQRQVFSLSSLGREIQISYPRWEIYPAVDQWHQLLIFHYLDLADGTPLSGRLMGFGDLPGGMVRGGGFDRQSEKELSLRLGSCQPEQVAQACRALGAALVPSNADICAVFSLFPNYPITLKLWFADEDFPGSGRLFLDRSASGYLTVEDAVTAGSLLMEALFRRLNTPR